MYVSPYGYYPPNTRLPCDRTYFQTYAQDLTTSTPCRWFRNRKRDPFALATVRTDAADLLYLDELERRLEGRRYKGKWEIPHAYRYPQIRIERACIHQRRRVYPPAFVSRLRGIVRYGYFFKEGGPQRRMLAMTYEEMGYRPFVPRKRWRGERPFAPLSQSPIGQPPHYDPNHICPMASYAPAEAVPPRQPKTPQTSTKRAPSETPTPIRAFIDSLLNW